MLDQPHVVSVALAVVKETDPLNKDLLNRPRLKRVPPFIKCFFFNKRMRYLYKNLRIAEWTGPIPLLHLTVSFKPIPLQCRHHYYCEAIRSSLPKGREGSQETQEDPGSQGH